MGAKEVAAIKSHPAKIAGIPWAIPAHRFDNAAKLMIAAEMPIEGIGKTLSNKLADYYGVDHPPLQGHDALDDAFSVAYAVQHRMRSGKLQPEVFERT